MTQRCTHLKAIVFDWAGTTVDHGSRAPAVVFQEIFRQRGIEISESQARGPMGMAKPDHIAAIAAMPPVAAAWQSKFGRPFEVSDVHAMYQDFLPLQRETLQHHCDVIPGVAQAVDVCRQLGLKIGSSTGYTHELMDIVTAAAQQQGYVPDCVLCAEDAPRGRPAPFLIYEAAKRLDVYPLTSIVKVDDTSVGIEAGRNAGCWTVGVTLTGNCVGRSADQVASLSAEARDELHAAAAQTLTDAGAHYTIPSAAKIVEVVHAIEQRMNQGESPDSK